MNHLRDGEFVDLIEGQLSADRADHAKACAACRSQAEALSAVLRTARIDEVPEPSPLFWNQLSKRISLGVLAPAPSWWSRLIGDDRWRLAAATVALIAAVGLTWQMLVRVNAPELPAPPPEIVEGPNASDLEGFVDAWDAIEAAAVDLDWEDGQSIGIAARPGSAERLVADLTAEERSELARLIEEELKRTGA